MNLIESVTYKLDALTFQIISDSMISGIWLLIKFLETWQMRLNPGTQSSLKFDREPISKTSIEFVFSVGASGGEKMIIIT